MEKDHTTLLAKKERLCVAHIIESNTHWGLHIYLYLYEWIGIYKRDVFGHSLQHNNTITTHSRRFYLLSSRK